MNHTDMFEENSQIEKDARAHAMAEYPNESVGCVVETGGKLQFLPLVNSSDNPKVSFKIQERPRCPMLAIIHSHTMDTSVAPSKVDMASQQASATPWGIIHCDGINTSKISWFGDQVPVEPLVGRSFLSGQRDCWGLVRDVYRTQFGITLRNIPRDENWYKHEPPHMEAEDLLGPESITETGFQIIPRNNMRAGDVVLGRIGRTGVVNHCGLVLEDQRILHHLEDRLSRTEPIGPWIRHVLFVTRHNSFMDKRVIVPKIQVAG